MLADLFKPAWKSSSVEKRLKAISEMDSKNSENQIILTELTANDTDNSVRIAAIHCLTSVIDLHEISMQNSSDAIVAEASKRLDELMTSEGAVSNEQYRNLLNHYPELHTRIAAYSALPAIRSEAMQNLATDQLMEMLGSTVYSDVRQLVAEKLSNIDDLESARKIVRGKDKNAERILKLKIDEYRELQRQLAENLATVKKLIDEVEFLAGHDWMPEFKAKLLVHREHWDKLDFEVERASNERYKKSRQIIDLRFEHQQVVEQTRQAQQKLVLDLEALLKDIGSCDLSGFTGSLSETLLQQEKFASDWQQLVDKACPHLLEQERFETMLAALQSATQLVIKSAEIISDKIDKNPADSTFSLLSGEIQQVKKNISKLDSLLKIHNWSAAYGELKVATELQAKLSEWRDLQKKLTTDRQQKLDGLHKKISSIFHFTRSGNLGRAKQFCERVEKGINQFEGKDRVALEDRFEEARKTLGKMGDWKNFATEPKYVELCEAMELLVSSKKHPDKISTEMKAFQKQWKMLGHSDISEKYWLRFKEAADKVYKPCAEFFEKRHETRKNNLQQRQQYVDQMRELLEDTDWDDNPDYKVAQSTVRVISDEFFKIKDVERNAGQKQWNKFSKLKDGVFEKLSIAYEANILLKQQLIQQAVTLAEAEASQDNLSKLKILQTRWKQVGITKRHQDQNAWIEFKKQGDLVYQKVQQLRQGKRDETDRQLNAYRSIIKQIKKLASSAKDLTEADQQFSALQIEFSNLPELPDSLPEKLVEGIQRDYRHACDLFDDCHNRIINTNHSRQIQALRLRADLCLLLEASAGAPSENQLEEISQQWDSIDLQDNVLARRIEERRQKAQTITDQNAIAAERRMLCIQLEIAKGVESPAEDKSLRMQYQLEQMNASGLGQQSDYSEEQFEKMELDWLCMPGADLSLQKTLDERFNKVLKSK